MRTLNSFKNIASSIGVTLVLTFLGFFTRKVFIDNLGEEFLGLNGLLSNVIGMLGLVESGIGVSIVYNMYKPLAEKDTPRILALVQLYRKIYRYIALGIVVLSVFFFPFVVFMVHGAVDMTYLTIVYCISIASTVIGYLMADKLSLLNSDQKGYKLAGYSLTYQVIMYGIKLYVLSVIKDYLLFVLIDFVCNAIYNLIIKRVVEKLYPYIKTKEKYKVEPEVTKNIIANVKALFFAALGGYMLHSTDNILISSYVGLATVGLYSNYTLLVNQVKSLVAPFMNGVKDSVGNLISSESREKQYEVFDMMFLVNFIAISFISIMLYCLLNPFIGWWLGPQYLFDQWVVGIICLNLYVDMIRSSAFIFKTSSGIFVQDKYVPFISGIVNLVVSMALAHFIGLPGILLGTSIAYLTTNSWNWPRLIFKITFQKSPRIYYQRYVMYAVFTVLMCLGINKLNTFISTDRFNIGVVIAYGVIDTLILGGMYFVLFHRTEAWQRAVQTVRTIFQSRKAYS